MKPIPSIPVLIIACGPAGCGQGDRYIETACAKMPDDTAEACEVALQCQQFRQAEAATAVYNEAMQFLRSYRACLERCEQTQTRAKEQ